MTRDGFIEMRLKHTGAFTKAAMPAEILREMIANEVDFYIAAGMLKLDEPKSLDERINYAINLEVCSNKLAQAREIKAALDRANLKIVEK